MTGKHGLKGPLWQLDILDSSPSDRRTDKRQWGRPIKEAWMSRYHHTLECHRQYFHKMAKTYRYPVCLLCTPLWSKQSPSLNPSRAMRAMLGSSGILHCWNEDSAPLLLTFLPSVPSLPGFPGSPLSPLKPGRPGRPGGPGGQSLHTSLEKKKKVSK